MRVSDQMRIRLAFRGLGKPRTKLGAVQEQVTSGRIVNRPSDDPSAAARILDLREALADIVQYQSNASKGRTLLGAAEGSLATAEQIFSRMGELSVQMANATVGARDRDAAAIEVAGAKEHLLDLFNTQSGDTFIFGGYSTQYDPADPLGKPWDDRDPLVDPLAIPGAYNGTTDEIEYDMGDGVQLPVTLRNSQTAFAGMWGVLDDFETALKADDTAGIEAGVDALSLSRDSLDRSRAEVGTKLNRISFSIDVLERVEVDLKSQLSDTEDADMLEVLAVFRQEEIALQAALQMASKIFQPTLMEFLR